MPQANSGRRRTSKRSNSEAASPRTARPKHSDPILANDDSGELDPESVIRLAEERLSVEKRIVETGRVRVHRTTTEQIRKVDVPLTSDTVEIRRVPVGRQIKQMPEVRETRTEIIIPVVEEVLVVERRLVLREELHIRKVRSVERHTEQVTLRVQKATVDRVAPQDSDVGSIRAARSERPSSTGRSGKQPPQPRKRK